MIALLAAAVLATATPAAPPAPLADVTDGARESLQELLRRAREERARLLAGLRPQVADLVGRLEALGRPEKRELAKLDAELDALGSESAVLLLPFLEPGSTAGEAERFRARQVARALSRQRSGAVTARLIMLVGQGTKEGRRNAMRVLGHSPDVETASACLRDVFANATGEMRREAVTALARLGGTKNEELLGTALFDQDETIVETVLEALAAAQAIGAADRVEALARGSDGGLGHRVSAEIIAYWHAVPDAVDEDVVLSLIELARRGRTPARERVTLLDAIPDFDPGYPSRVKKALEPLLAASDTSVREAAQICAALLGDRGARKEILRNYDDLVKRQSRWPNVYEQRAGVLLKLREYGDAVRDYKKAIELLEEQKRTVDRELWIGMARAYARDGKEKQAHDALKDGSLPPSLLSALADDPDFADVAAHSRYGKIFER